MVKYLPFLAFLLWGNVVSAQWTSNTALNTPICTATGKQVDPRILEDGKGGAIIVWKDYRTGVPDVYVQRIDKNGFVKWTVNGVGACTNPSDQSTPNICSDGQGGCIVTWSDWRSGIERDLYAQRLDSNGTILWTTDGVIVTNKQEREHNEKIASDGSGGAIIVWEQQNFTGYWDEWAQRINSSGNIMWTAGGVPLCTVTGNRINGRIEGDGKGGAYIVWQDFRNGTNYDIYAQHMSPGGNRLWNNNAKLICNAAGTQASPKIEPDPITGGFYVAWVDGRSANNDIYVQRVDSLGNLSWTTNGISACSAAGNQSALDILTDNSIDGIILTWKDRRSGTYDIYSQRMNTAGTVQWITNGVAVCTNNFDQLNPNLAIDMAGGAIISWQDSATGDFNIRAQRVNANGTLLWAAAGVNVGTAASDQTSVKNCTDGQNGSIFVFMDKRTGTNDIYAHHLYANGTTVNGVSENQLSSMEIYPNPFVNSIRISADQFNSSELEIEITDMSGRILNAYQTNILSGDGKVVVDIATDENWAEGIYLFRISDKSHSVVGKAILLR